MTVVMWGEGYVDRYVDAVGGLDANDGKTTATAWQTISKINGLGAAAAGMRILFRKGQTWTGTKLTVPANNMAFGAWGSGANPIIDGADTVDCFDSNGHNNLYINDLEVTQGLDFGFAFDGVSGITVVNCSAHDCGNDQLILSVCTNCNVNGGRYYNAYTRLTDNRMTSGIEVKDACSDIVIDGVECYGNVGVASPAHYSTGIAIHAHTGTVLAKNVTVRNCNLHDGGLNTFGLRVDNANAATMTDRNIVIENNTITGNQYGGIQINTSAGASYPTNGVTIRGNVIRHNTNRFQVHLINSKNLRVYQNVIANNDATQNGQNASIDNCLEVEFANNTLYSFFDDFNFSLLINGGATGNVRVRNNILGGSIASAMLVYVAAATGTTGLVIDRNLYQYASTGNRWSWLGTNMNYTTWKANNSNDANSPARQDPLLTNPAGNDYSLQAGSPAINQGTAIAGITDGYLGAAPDLGYKEKS